MTCPNLCSLQNTCLWAALPSQAVSSFQHSLTSKAAPHLPLSSPLGSPSASSPTGLQGHQTWHICPTYPLGTHSLIYLCVPSTAHSNCLWNSYKNKEIKPYLLRQKMFLHTEMISLARIPTIPSLCSVT